MINRFGAPTSIMDSDQTKHPIIDEDASRSCDARRRHGVAFVASAAAHAIVLFALVLLLPEVERPHHDWVLAYLVEFDRPAIPGRGAGAVAGRTDGDRGGR